MDTIIHGQGKRKRAVARATIKTGRGHIRINGNDIESLHNSLFKQRIEEPLLLIGNQADSLDIDIKTIGGGIYGQADAARLAIARGLVQLKPEFEKEFEMYDRQLLVADVRRKEVRKPNDSKARAARQKSYR